VTILKNCLASKDKHPVETQASLIKDWESEQKLKELLSIEEFFKLQASSSNESPETLQFRQQIFGKIIQQQQVKLTSEASPLK
jgi:hypothetical protein